MEWKELSNISKFTPLKDVFKIVGSPKIKLGSRPVYYLGDGFLISFSPKMFKIENSARVEYGDEGEYALNVYYFKSKHEVEAYFKIKEEQYSFEGDTLGNGSFEIVDEIGTDCTYEQVIACLRPKSTSGYYQEGETRAFNNGIFAFQNNFVTWDNYTFLFFGKSKKTKISGFEYTFKE